MTMTLIDWSARISAMADALSDLDGGFSVDPSDGSAICTGCAVAMHLEHERIFDGRVTSNDLHEYIAQVKDALSLHGRFLGGWRNPETGRVHLDVSIATPYLFYAMKLAQETAQLAIFDFCTMESLPVALPVAA